MAYHSPPPPPPPPPLTQDWLSIFIPPIPPPPSCLSTYPFLWIGKEIEYMLHLHLLTCNWWWSSHRDETSTYGGRESLIWMQWFGHHHPIVSHSWVEMVLVLLVGCATVHHCSLSCAEQNLWWCCRDIGNSHHLCSMNITEGGREWRLSLFLKAVFNQTHSSKGRQSHESYYTSMKIIGNVKGCRNGITKSIQTR